MYRIEVGKPHLLAGDLGLQFLATGHDHRSAFCSGISFSQPRCISGKGMLRLNIRRQQRRSA
jgi:hypothetical protein